MTMLWIVFWLIVCIYCIHLLIKRKRLVDALDKIPGPKAFPIVGNLLQIGIFLPFSKPTLLHPLTVVLQYREGLRVLYPNENIIRVWVGMRPSVIFLKPLAIEKILGSSVSINKSLFYDLLHPWLGKGLLTSSGNEWRKKRKLLTPAFHFRILYDFVPVMNAHAQYLIQKITTDHPINIVPLLSLCTLDIICETAMGVSINAQRNSQSEYVQSVQKVSNLVIKRASQPWLWSNTIYYLTSDGKHFKKCLLVLHRFTKQIIENKLNGFKRVNFLEDSGTKKKRLAFLDLLLKQHVTNGTFSLEEIREEVDTFMFEGHDTTSVGITWSLYLIGLHDHVQCRLHEEIDNILKYDESHDISFEECKEMTYLECVLKESQRLYPSVPVMMRNLGEDTQIGEYVIPKGTNVSVPVYVMQRDPQVYPQPEIFDPDRFSSVITSNQHPYSYIPFSAGPRNCIGKRFAVLEEKIIVANILRRFSIRSLQPRDKIKIVPELVLRPLEDITIKFSSRNTIH